MRKRRIETFAERSAELFRENTFGGSKLGHIKAAEKQIPIVSNNEGIKIEWDKWAHDYPSSVSLKMTDGTWVKYKIEIIQPGYQFDGKKPEERKTAGAKGDATSWKSRIFENEI